MLKKENEFLSNFDRISINELASGIADIYSPNNRIEPELIAEKVGVTYSYGNYGINSFDGMLEHRSGRFHIYINKDCHDNIYSDRARFTFAHELGHYFIDEHRTALESGISSHCSFTGFKTKDRVERQADYFASCLLLPEERVKSYCRRKIFSFSIIEELSKKFSVSFSATSLRFSAIGMHPIMVVYSYKNNISWYWSSQDFPFKYLLHGKYKLPEDTVAGEYFLKGFYPKTSEEVWAMDWFDYVKEGDIKRKFKEQCKIHGDHCLSIIWEN